MLVELVDEVVVVCECMIWYLVVVVDYVVVDYVFVVDFCDF